MSFIRVQCLCCDAMIFDIVQSLIILTSTTAKVSIFPWAVNKLLLRKKNRFSFHQRHRFKSGYSTKSPAWSAISLIFYRCNHTLCSPVYISSNFDKGSINFFPLRIIRFWAQINWRELLVGQCREFVDTHIVCSWFI